MATKNTIAKPIRILRRIRLAFLLAILRKTLYHNHIRVSSITCSATVLTYARLLSA